MKTIEHSQSPISRHLIIAYDLQTQKPSSIYQNSIEEVCESLIKSFLNGPDYLRITPFALEHK